MLGTAALVYQLALGNSPNNVLNIQQNNNIDALDMKEAVDFYAELMSSVDSHRKNSILNLINRII